MFNLYRFCLIAQFKSNLYNLVTEYASKEAKERIQETHYEFVDCVKQILSATKVLTYA